MGRRKPNIILFTFFGITALLWLASKPNIDVIYHFPLVSLRQITALFGITALSLQYMLVTRTKLVERLFNGLDKVYKYHHSLGVTAFMLLLAHPTLLFLSLLPHWDSVLYYFTPLNDKIYTFGVMALMIMATLIFITLYVKLPYHIWKMSHRFMGMVILLAALHVYLVPSDISIYMPLRYWILGLITVGICSWIYKTLLYRFIGPKYIYEVVSVKQLANVNEILMKPVGNEKKVEHNPGQFIFVAFDNNELGAERHPYSISSYPGDEQLRISVKKDGDYTNRLGLVKSGDRAKLYGPYGLFSEKFMISDRDQVWIAGGIGVTPFLSMLKYEEKNSRERKIAFYYCTSDSNDAAYSEEISNGVAKLKQVSYKHQKSAEVGRLNIDQLAKELGSLEKKLFFICGPKAMMKELTSNLIKRGVHPRNIIYEDFSL